MKHDQKLARIFEAFMFGVAIVCLLVIGIGASQAQPYVEAGVSFHQEGWAKPEVDLEAPLGTVEAGYTFRPILGGEPSVYVRHISSITEYENGYGITGIGVKGRWEWK